MTRSSSFRYSARSALSPLRKRTERPPAAAAGAVETQVDSLVTELAASAGRSAVEVSASTMATVTPERGASAEPVVTDARTAAPASRLSALPSVGASSTAIDLLWNQRQVAHYGTLTRIEVPIDGPIEALPTCRSLSVELERRWVARRSLAPRATPTSVVVEVVSEFGSPTRLVLLVTADALPIEHSPLSLAMARDIRAALRVLGGNEHLRTVPEMRFVSDSLA